MNDPRTMTEIYKNLPWMYSLLKDEGTGAYYLNVVCGTVGWYEVSLLLTETEVAVFLPAIAAGQPNAMLGLVREIIGHGATGIPGREYLRETRPVRPQS